jgi:hypothetical protein
MNKQEWKIFYRKLRVTRREAMKVAIDTMVYGTGVMYVPDDGSDCKRIHPSEIQLTDEGDTR